MSEIEKKEETSGIAILPKTDDRPIGVVGMGDSEADTEQLKALSERLTSIGMEHVLLSMEDAKKEGVTREELEASQLAQSQTDNLLSPNPIFNNQLNKRNDGSNMKAKSKRRKKAKKTHRK